MSPLPGPILLLALPLLASIVAYLLRRWAILAALVAAATTGVLALLCAFLPLDRSAFVLGQEVALGRPVVIVGRNLVLDPAGQAWLAFAFALATVFYLLAWRTPQGRGFFSVSLVILSLYAGVALLHNLPLAVIVLAISACLAVLIIQEPPAGSIRGAQRYLVVMLLAVPLLLAAVWLVDQSRLDPNSVDLARQALLPMMLGFGLLLAVFPFGTWMPALAADAPPLVTGFVFTAGQAMALYLVLIFLQGMPTSLDDPTLQSAIQLSGLVMAIAGGLMAAVQRDFGRLFGYAALGSLGMLLLAFSVGGSQGLTLALLHGVNRAAAIVLMAASLAVLRQRAATDHFDRLQGVARRLPVAAGGLLLGGLALAGFPLTAGFATHWAISRAVWNWAQPFSALAQETALAGETLPVQQWASTLAFVALLVASAGVVVGLLRGLSATLGASPGDAVGRQPRLASLLILALAGLVIVLGLHPQLLLGPVETAVRALSLF